MVVALQTMVTRGFDVFDPVVVTVGRFAGGTKDNIIPDEAVFEATLRSLSPQSRATLTDGVQRLVRGIAEAHGLRVEIELKPGYPVTVNDEREYDVAVQTVTELFGRERFTTMATPELGSEDMAFVFDEVPGAYLFISACPDADYENAPDNHSPRALFDDSVLPDAAAWLAAVALRRLRLAAD
jgi:hippurate hydrolase